ncbi:MAG: S1 RNA-binding domain-containing protein [Planctomyces sp.]|nr:S1 RNA-binding domain-containing protein [Planctomyces sp.]
MSSEQSIGTTHETAPPPAAPPAPAAEPSADSGSGPVETPEQPQAAAPEESGGERRLRLNPVADPAQFKPRPSISEEGAEAVAGSDASPAEAQLVAAAEQARDSAPPPPPRQAVEIPRDVDLDAETEAEIAAALASGELGELSPVTPAPEEGAAEDGEAAEAPAPGELAPGTKLIATIQTIHGDNVFVDFGLRTTGVVSLRQFNPQKPPQVGDKQEVVVDRLDEKEGLALCNLPRGRTRASGDWDALAVGQVVDCIVEKTNKGGLEVKVSTLRGFMPASQVEMGYIANLDQYVGQKLQARITEVKPARRRLILSRRALLAEEREHSEKEVLQTLEPGAQLPGRVKTIKDYGAFIDIGGIDGFLHIGQMSWVRISHPSEILQEGQQVQVQVLSIDKDSKKISLGMRQLAANPWGLAADKYAKGTQATGKVTRTEPFGAFIELEPGVEGLVHISELDHKRVKRVTEVLDVGQMVEVQVLEVDPGRKRISLSVKALKAKPEAPAKPSDEELAPGKGQAYERRSKGPLKGGIGGNLGGGLFGNPRDFTG